MTEFTHISNDNGPESWSRRLARSAHDAIDVATARAEHLERNLRMSIPADIARHNVPHAPASGARHDPADVIAAETTRALDDFEALIREKPMTVAGVALIGGLIAAALMRR
jgi:hypothetical protein